MLPFSADESLIRLSILGKRQIYFQQKTIISKIITAKSQTLKEKIVMSLMEKIKSQKRQNSKLPVMTLNKKMTTLMLRNLIL